MIGWLSHFCSHLEIWPLLGENSVRHQKAQKMCRHAEMDSVVYLISDILRWDCHEQHFKMCLLKFTQHRHGDNSCNTSFFKVVSRTVPRTGELSSHSLNPSNLGSCLRAIENSFSSIWWTRQKNNKGTKTSRRRKGSTVRHCEVNVFSRCDPETWAGYAI